MFQIVNFMCLVCLNVSANLLMRSGASDTTETDGYAALINWKSLTGVACFGLAAIVYLLLLRKMPLAIAQGFLSVQFLVTIGSAQFLLKERLDPIQWIAMLLIALGITLLGWRSFSNDQIKI